MDQGKEKFKYVQMYRADFNESLPGHPRWTLYSKGNTPPPNPPPPPSPPAPKSSVAYCATKELAYNFSLALMARTSPSLAHVADDVFRALQLGAECNQSHAANENIVPPKFFETHSTAKWSSRATTRIVDCQNGHDTRNDGLSLSSPLRSISQALRSLSRRGHSAPPGLVYIRAGTCYLQVGRVIGAMVANKDERSPPRTRHACFLICQCQHFFPAQTYCFLICQCQHFLPAQTYCFLICQYQHFLPAQTY